MEGEREEEREQGGRNWKGKERKGKRERKESLTESAISTHEESYLNM